MNALAAAEATLADLEKPGHAVVLTHRRHMWLKSDPHATADQVEAAKNAHAAAIAAHKTHGATVEAQTGQPLSRLIDAAAQRVIDAREKPGV